MAKSKVIYEYDKIAAGEGKGTDGVLYISKKQFDLLENFILSNKNDGENTTEFMRLQSKNGKKICRRLQLCGRYYPCRWHHDRDFAQDRQGQLSGKRGARTAYKNAA